MATLTCPGCAAAVQQDDLICFTCGANLPRPEQPDEPTIPPTVMQESLRRDGATASSLAPAVCPHCAAAIPDRSLLSCPACSRRLPRSSGPISRYSWMARAFEIDVDAERFRALVSA